MFSPIAPVWEYKVTHNQVAAALNGYKEALLKAPFPLRNYANLSNFIAFHHTKIFNIPVFNDRLDDSEQNLCDLLNYFQQLTRLVQALTSMTAELAKARQNKDLPCCDKVPLELLQQFDASIQASYSEAFEVASRIIRFPISNNIGEDEASCEDIKRLTEVINCMEVLYKDPTNDDNLTIFSNSIAGLQTSTFKAQSLVGNLLTALGFAMIIATLPLSLTYGMVLGLAVGILGAMTGFLGQALRNESNAEIPPTEFFKDAKLIKDGEELKSTAKKVQSASGRYPFFNASIFDTTIWSQSSNTVMLPRPIL
ncbi:MAG: hypothetical protein V4501_10135 [Pseudomonadota bacterium]